MNVLPDGVEKQGKTSVNSTVSKPTEKEMSQKNSEKEDKNQDRSTGSHSTVKLVDINVQVPQTLHNFGELSGLVNIHFHFN